MSNTVRYARSGLSFVEILVVLLIMGVFAGIAIPSFMGWYEKSKVSSTQSSLNVLQGAIDSFHLSSGQYPEKLEDLVVQPKGDRGKNWSQWLKRDKLPKDGWDRDFQYKLTPKAKKPYELYSYGKGGPDATGDEDTRISVWDL